jgi:hypothetical protein
LINLFLAGIWLVLGILFLVNPWENRDERQTMLGWFALGLAAYNLIRWRFQVMAQRRDEDWRRLTEDEPHPPKVRDSSFNFTDLDRRDGPK